MGKWCGNIGCGEYDSKEKCGCHLHGEYAYDCIDFTEGEEPQNLPTANVKPTLSEVTDRMINSACLSYRHDFGLLTEEEQNRMRIEAKEWLRAWKKEFGHFA